MNDIKGFTFYKNYYELIKYLPDEERLKLIDGILKYMFDNQETQFNGLLNGIWINLRMPLDNSKSSIEKGKKGGAPKGNNNAKKTTKKQPKNNLKTSQKQANNISIFLFLISNFNLINNNEVLKNKIIEFLEYKEFEKKETYKERGMQSLLKQITNKVEQYGDKAVIDLITECMANNWKGIIWDRIIKTNENKTPTWFNQEIKERERTDEEQRQLEELIRGY